MEMRDLYFRDGTPMGLTVEKHTPLKAGQYVLHAIILLKTADGRWIMQQRSLKSRFSPGEWDVTGGGVSAGETSAQAAAREAMEELGVEVRPEDLKWMFREVLDWGGDTGALADTFAVRTEIPKDGFRISEREVNDVRCVDFETFEKTVMYNKTPEFRRALRRAEAEI